MSADNSVGRFLLSLVTSIPQIDHDQFEDMLNSNMKVSGGGFHLCGFALFCPLLKDIFIEYYLYIALSCPIK